MTEDVHEIVRAWVQVVTKKHYAPGDDSFVDDPLIWRALMKKLTHTDPIFDAGRINELCTVAQVGPQRLLAKLATYRHQSPPLLQ